jgi:GTPase SAR1 family protein
MRFDSLSADYAVKTLTWKDREAVRLHMWDLAGQDHFRQMSRTYFRGASGCVVMFDVTDRQTFENVAVWKADLDSKVVLPSGRPIPCILAANKDDEQSKCVSSHELSKFAKERGFFSFVFMSVKENRNVTEMMTQLVEQMISVEESLGMVQQAEDISTRLIRIENSKQSSKSESCVCAR